MRMTPNTFDQLLGMVGTKIKKVNTKLRAAISYEH